ncbi:MAG: alcohol dehydrogenase catalytic domain-containing protein [Nanoarchaeota archaeon]
MVRIKPVVAIKYQVVSPETVQVMEYVIDEVPDGYILVKPVLTGICQSDLRYYFGRRNPEVLKKRYPLCLLHEGIAEVVEGNNKFKKGQKVVIIPNIPCYMHKSPADKCASCENQLSENYCLDVKFMSSNCDGMTQTYFLQPAECALPVPETVPDDIAVLAELLTVTYRASIEANITEKDKVVVFGCGPTGYLMAALLHFGKKIEKSKLFIIDVSDKKLNHAKDFATTINADKDKMPEEMSFDKAFECVGRQSSEIAIDNALKLLKPKGILVLLGVSEEKRAVMTRAILDKGLTIKGTTRSPRQDYLPILSLLKNKPFQKALFKIICRERFIIRSKQDLIDAFKRADDPKHYGKVLIDWNN